MTQHLSRGFAHDTGAPCYCSPECRAEAPAIKARLVTMCTKCARTRAECTCPVHPNNPNHNTHKENPDMPTKPATKKNADGVDALITDDRCANAAALDNDTTAQAAAVFARYMTPVVDLTALDPDKYDATAARLTAARSVVDPSTGKQIRRDRIVPILLDVDPADTAEPCKLGEPAALMIGGEVFRRRFTPEYPQQTGDPFIIMLPIPQDSPLYDPDRSRFALVLAECVKTRELIGKGSVSSRVPNTYQPRYLGITRTFRTDVQANAAVDAMAEANSSVWASAWETHVERMREQAGAWDDAADVAAVLAQPNAAASAAF